MLHIVLYEPEIPPNTGNVIRLCANCGAQLHLIHPLGFKLEDRALKRAGLDYHEYAAVREYDNWQAFRSEHSQLPLYALTTHATRCYSDAPLSEPCALVFGPESRGLPQALLAQLPDTQRLRIPMKADSRSLNLSNAVAILVYEALRQRAFAGLR